MARCDGLLWNGECPRPGAPRARGRSLWMVVAAATLVLLQALPTQAQQRMRQARPLANPPTEFIPCAVAGQPLLRVPELVAQGNVLRGTIVLKDTPERMDL